MWGENWACSARVSATTSTTVLLCCWHPQIQNILCPEVVTGMGLDGAGTLMHYAAHSRPERVLGLLGLGVVVSSEETARVTSLPPQPSFLGGGCGEGGSSGFQSWSPEFSVCISSWASICPCLPQTCLHTYYSPGRGSGGAIMKEIHKIHHGAYM